MVFLFLWWLFLYALLIVYFETKPWKEKGNDWMRNLENDLITWITRILRPVSVANCSRWVLFGLGHESNALFKI